MKPTPRRLFSWFLLAIVFLVLLHFALPFGLIPKLAFPNCGPEGWAWLEARFENKQNVIAYLQAHELQYLSGSSLPRLVDIPPDMKITRFDVEIDWQALEQTIEVENRLFYKIYNLTYTHPACMKGQYYTLRVTSFGWASLYGCCGI